MTWSLLLWISIAIVLAWVAAFAVGYGAAILTDRWSR